MYSCHGTKQLLPSTKLQMPLFKLMPLFTSPLSHSLPYSLHFASLRSMLYFSSCPGRLVPSGTISYIFPLYFLTLNMLKSPASFNPPTSLNPFFQLPGLELLQSV